MSRRPLLVPALWASLAISTGLGSVAAQQESESPTLRTESPTLGNSAGPDPVRRFSETLRESRQALAEYRWRARTEIRIDGKELIVQLFDVRLDREGRLRHVLIGHEREDAALAGPLRRRIEPVGADGESDLPDDRPVPALPAEEQAAALKRIAESYTHPQPARVRDLGLLPASLMPLPPDVGRLEGGISLRLYDAMRDGDTVEVWIESPNDRPLRLEAYTDLEGTPVVVTAWYSELPDGPVYVARTLTRTTIEGREVEVRGETLGFSKREPAD